jgi:hypothetical protein
MDLSDDVHAALGELGRALFHRNRLDAEIQRALALMDGLPPEAIARADGQIRDAVGMWGYRDEPGWFAQLLGTPTQRERLSRTPGIEYIFLFHGNGRLREAALHKIDGALSSSFMVAAIQWRANDWVGQVRSAALACAERCMPKTRPEPIATATLALLERHRSWGRWEDNALTIDQCLMRADVAELIAKTVRTAGTGPMARVLRDALKCSSMDMHLETLAIEAVQPAVRATALQSLINRKARWTTVWRWRRLVAERDLEAGRPVLDYIEMGLRDRSPFVRGVSLAGVIEHLLPDQGPLAGKLAAPFLTDKSRAVRERAGFIVRTTAEPEDVP